MKSGFRILEHTADMGLALFSPSLEGIYEAGGRGLFHVIAPDRPAPDMARLVVSEGAEPELLLVNFLNDLLLLFEVEGLLFMEFCTKELERERLVMETRCARLDPDAEMIDRLVKAVTLHNLALKKEGDLWQATLFLDL